MATAVATAAALLLAGCGGSEPAAAPPPLPARTSPAPSAYSPAPLPSPRASAGIDREVEEAVLAYFAGINRLLATGERAAFDATYAPACDACAQFSAKVAADYAAGRSSDARDEVLSLQVAGGNSANAGAATVEFRVPAYRIVAADGSEVGSYPESRSTRIFTVARTAAGFRVVAIQDPKA